MRTFNLADFTTDQLLTQYRANYATLVDCWEKAKAAAQQGKKYRGYTPDKLHAQVVKFAAIITALEAKQAAEAK